MQGFKVCGDVKAVTLTLRAIAYFYKSAHSFLIETEGYTSEQRERYCKLLVAEYQQFQQFQEIAVGIDGR